MINVYLRCTPQVANHIQLFREAVNKSAAEPGMSVEAALRTLPASAARAAATAAYHADLVVPPGETQQPSAEEWILARAEIARLQVEVAAHRQRAEEADAKAARDREQAARDLARVIGERDAAKRASLAGSA